MKSKDKRMSSSIMITALSGENQVGRKVRLRRAGELNIAEIQD